MGPRKPGNATEKIIKGQKVKDIKLRVNISTAYKVEKNLMTEKITFFFLRKLLIFYLDWKSGLITVYTTMY